MHDFNDSSSTFSIVLLPRFYRAIVCSIILDAKNVPSNKKKWLLKYKRSETLPIE